MNALSSRLFWGFLVSAFSAVAPAIAAPANDLFSNRIILSGTNASSSTRVEGATHEPGEPNPNSVFQGGSVWWEWTAPFDGGVAVEGRGTYFSPALSVFTGDAVTNLTLVAKAQEGNSKVGLLARIGQTYEFALDVPGTPSGSVTLLIHPGPTNDNFASRTPITGLPVTSSSIFGGASHEPGEPNPNKTSPGASVWWDWTSTISGGVAVSASGSIWTPTIAVFTGDSLTNLQVVDGGVSVQGSCAFRAAAGQHYAIALDSGGFVSGSAILKLTPGPANDDFAHPLLLTGPGGTARGTLDGATLEAGEASLWLDSPSASIWWQWSAPLTEGVAVELTGANSDPELGVFTGDRLDRLTPVGVTHAGYPVRLSFLAEAGVTYSIGAVDGGGGRGSVTMAIKPGPPNDTLARATPLTTAPYVARGTTVGATVDPQANAFGLGGQRLAWYSWSAPASGGFELKIAAGDDPATAIVCSGDSLTNLVLRARADAVPGTSGNTPFRAAAGEVLLILANVQVPQGDPFTLTIVPGPPNDDFQNREAITNLNGFYYASTVGATLEPGESTPPWPGGSRTVWWTWTAPATGGYLITRWPYSAPPGIAVYQGEEITNLVSIPTVSFQITDAPQTVLRAIAGEQFIIALADADAAGRTVGLNIQSGLSNDDFIQATPLQGVNQPIIGNNLAATIEPDEPVFDPRQDASLWYTWVTSTNGTFVAHLDNSVSGLLVAVCTGDSLTNLITIAGPGLEAAFPAEVGIVYHLVVVNPPYARGQFSLTLSPVDANDDFAQRAALAGLPVTNVITEFLASVEPNEPIHGDLTNAPSLWWRWTAPATGGYQVGLHGGYGTRAVAVYTGVELNNLSLVAATTADGPDLLTFFHGEAGVEYQIAVAQEPELTQIKRHRGS